MTTPSAAPVPEKGLFSRLLGVLFSPRATFASIAAYPKILGALLTVVVIIAAIQYVFLSSEIGQRAMLDQQISMIESFGRPVSDQALAGMQQRLSFGRYFAVAGIVLGAPIVWAVMAGLVLVVFNAIMGGEGTFRQVYAIVVHTGVIGVVQQLFATPLNYARESMASATSLNVFLPMVDSSSFAGMLLGSIDLFRVWSFVSLSIGIAVLYKRRTGPIAWSLLALYAIIVIIVAGVRVALSGA